MIFKVVTKFEVISSLTIILNPKIFQWVEGPQQARADRADEMCRKLKVWKLD